MSEVKTIVAKSHNVKDAALNLNVKLYDVRRTLAATWNLAPTPAQPPSPETAFSLDMRNEGQESVVGDSDQRRLVDKDHFAPGGKYRCKSIVVFLLQSTPLTLLSSNRKAFHPLRVPKARGLGHGYRLAYQA